METQFDHFQVDLLASSLSEKYVKQLMKFLGNEVEHTRHLGYYATWCHCILSHHGLWIKRKSKDLLPVLNHLQKSLTVKSHDLSDLCERNVQTVDFLISVSKMRQQKEVSKDITVENENESEASEEEDEEPEIMDEGLTSKWSDESSDES